MAEEYILKQSASEVQRAIDNALNPDTTLTESGKPADAKTVGDLFAQLMKPTEKTDAELLTYGIFLSEEDIILGALWVSTSTDAPVTVANNVCTRKFETAIIPNVSVEKTGINTVVFWKNGSPVGEKKWTDISETLTVDFEFDHLAFNFGFGYANFVSGTAVVRLFYNELAPYKKVLVIGDSISTDYYGSYTKWVTHLINQKFFPADTTNDSIHATGFVAHYDNTNKDDDFIQRIEAVEDKDKFDLVVVFGGINDFLQHIPMDADEGGTADKTTHFKPAVDFFFEYLTQNFIQARIVVLTPLRTSSKYKNTAGHDQTEYADYIKEVAKSYCLPVLNLTEESGFYPFNVDFKNRWTLIPEGYTEGDGVHPNAEYEEKYLTPMIKNFLSKFI